MSSSARPLTLLWLGQMLSAIGDVLHEIALMWIAVEAIGERAGLVALAGPLTRLVFGLAGGVYADRWDRQRAMIAADLLRAGAVGTLALAALMGPLSLWHLAFVAAVLGLLDSVFSPALQASLPALAPQPDVLQRANAWLNINHRLARIVGPGVAGALLAFSPISQFFSVDAATFVASALLIRALGRGYRWKSPPAEDVPRSVVDEIGSALRLVREHRALLWGISLIAVWNVSSASINIVGIPLFAREVLGGGPALYGYIMAAYGVGNVASNLFLARWPVRGRLEPVLFAGGLIYGVCWLGLAFAPSLTAALVLAACAAVGGPMTDLMLLILIQSDIPPEHIGKVFSVRRTVSQACNGLGLVVSGFVFAWLPVPTGIGVAAAVVAAFSAVALLRFARAPRP